jgi:hypothetical protein
MIKLKVFESAKRSLLSIKKGSCTIGASLPSSLRERGLKKGRYYKPHHYKRKN